MFERRAVPAYLTIALGVALTAAFVVFGGYRFSAPLLILPPLWGVLLLAAGPLARRIGHDRLGGCCEAVALIYCQGIVICAALPMLAAHSAPFADSLLLRVDHAFGFDWLAFVMAARDHPALLSLARGIYMSFTWQPALELILLFCFRHEDRAWRLVNAAAISLLLTVAMFPLFPAVGGFEHFNISKAMYPNLDARTPWEFGQAILQMKAGTKLITPELMVGYVSFPSYHAVAALLMAWAMWPFRALRWPFVLLNLAMAVSAMIVGAHYLTDMLGGGAVAVVGLALARQVDDAPVRRVEPAGAGC